LSNILLNSNEEGIFDVRIADFGLADSVAIGVSLSKKCGTPSYIAPEILKAEEYNFKADIFSIGAVMYNLSQKEHLFKGKN
jgi:serine/threonine protein kinase